MQKINGKQCLTRVKEDVEKETNRIPFLLFYIFPMYAIIYAKVLNKRIKGVLKWKIRKH